MDSEDQNVYLCPQWEEIKNVQQRFKEDRRIIDLNEALSSRDRVRINLKGLMGSGASYAFAGNFLLHQGSHLLIANDKEQAAYLSNEYKPYFAQSSHWIFSGFF